MLRTEKQSKHGSNVWKEDELQRLYVEGMKNVLSENNRESLGKELNSAIAWFNQPA
jgi:hypothetical protein